MNFNQSHRGIKFNSKPLHDELLLKLKGIIKDRWSPQLRARLRELQAKEESDPVRQEVAWIMENQYDFSSEEFIDEIQEITGIGDADLTQEVTSVTCNDKKLVYFWRLDDNHRFTRSKFSSLEYDDEDSPMHKMRFLHDSFLIELKYEDLTDWYVPGNLFWIIVHFKIPLSLDGLLLDKIKRSPPQERRSHRLDGLLL